MRDTQELTAAQAALWRLSEERHAKDERRELIRAWAEYYRTLERNFRAHAREHAEKAHALEAALIVGEGGGGYA